ncbi:MAG: hypothetical protein ACRDLN_16085, partial [Solirubrobacteraceae bacterium]
MITPDLGQQTTADETSAPDEPAGRDESVAAEPRPVGDAPGRIAPAEGGCGLRFSRPGGPVLVICGLHGGAGTTTLAYAVAAQAAHESPATVLICETDAAAGDVAALAGVTSPYSLSELAAEFAVGRTPEGGT